MTIGNVAIIGAGTMGSGIAHVCAASGINIVILDISEEALQRGFSAISDSLDRSIKKQKLTADAKREILGRINVTTRYSDIAGVDLAIEAASENEALKLRLLKEIETVVSAKAIIATNTSSISITKLAGSTRLPERVIGTHFFNPVPLMALVELIRGLQTSDETQERVEAFVKEIGKSSIVAKNSPGFAVNRILCPMINEAVFALQEGLATPEDIDNGMKLGANHPIGPLALADLIGLDTMLAVLDVFYHGFNDPKYRPAPLLREMVDAGYLGRKNGRGFYQYD
ncbi:3-hydroxybutyryl-CoA dehydrogenase [Paraburkholderia elongata]|uniref:3-hydroxybutyryl-CoA dehydrogenase n=1 Tax=Paraburkholderia elongata TaxID=2675747 RepID=A0A972NSV3_9BURK|nr:3-hydroxybutyryl-CoA dehydrogenase [Paraburkholderia elongata]NPT58471.1 3-hydroxybutyryl-CoA dehydrogenase [Paraburkholderia elongata]